MRIAVVATLVLAAWMLLPRAALAQSCRPGSPSCKGLLDNLGTALDTAGTAGTPAPAPTNDFTVPRGQITFDAEGMEGGKYHSRAPHWPGGASGVTIGRGYDMKYRTAAEVKADLLEAGVDAKTATTLSGGAGKKLLKAKSFVKTNKKVELTPAQQKALFDTTWAEYETMTRDLVSGWAGHSKDKDTFWSALDPSIRDLLVDLRYRGDLTEGRYDSTLSNSVEANDVLGLSKVMENRKTWKAVPDDRFERRKDFMKAAADRS